MTGGDSAWVYWMAGIAAVALLVYLLAVLFRAERLD